jgi:hypothetical protein
MLGISSVTEQLLASDARLSSVELLLLLLFIYLFKLQMGFYPMSVEKNKIHRERESI